ncbi:GIY-YIG nuclease family protein [Candidatus Jorgensenbacteria bacterium]|nr:GIY-YIG nuclease family protein [Candidatus Jorgensenbacteria bacterium]MBI5732848.1 GIY-YIG nuclease family protein [Candidatus Jorgensenbacteria bacterium]
MYYVYIIQSLKKDTSYYTGLTSDIERRLKEHNKSDTKTTRSNKPWKLIYIEKFENRPAARIREKYLKSGVGREFRNKILPR